jgi:hypothetical protein
VPEVPFVNAPASVAGEAGRQQVDLTACPPFRAQLLRTGGDDHTLRLQVHRILCDGASMRLLLGEIGALYLNSQGQSILPLLDTSIQYADYASWERAWLTGETLTRQVEYFRRHLEGADDALALPTDHPRTRQRLRHGGALRFDLRPQVSGGVQNMAAREQASVYTVLLAAFAAALGKYTENPAVVIGSPVSRRNQPETEQMLGQFMNTLPLRIDLSEGANFPDLVRHAKAVLLAALSQQDAPFGQVISECGLTSGIGEVALVMADPSPREITMNEISLSRVEAGHMTSRRELTLSVTISDDQISGTMTYDRDLFHVETILRIVGDFEAGLASAQNHHA